MTLIAVIDSETDPFAPGVIPKPFVWGFYDGTMFYKFWGDDCTEQLIAFLKNYEEPLLLYAHNGGKFDFFFLLDHINSELRIVNNRILQCWIGAHELRDSYAIIPIPLRAYEKDEIDYDKMHRSKRELHKPEITKYLRGDCVYLYELVTGFHKEFGDKLTIGGTAMKELKKFHSFASAGPEYDKFFRQFYFGGRNQCFKSGTIQGDYKIYDVNSMYPFVMKEYKHPVSVQHEIQRKIGPKTMFASIEARNYGALPIRTKTGIDFTCERGTFFASIHEIQAAQETGTLEITRVKWTVDFAQTISFDSFVDHFYSQRLKAAAANDKMRVLFYKLVLNSAYGKFAQNPENYFEHYLTRMEMLEQPWEVAEQNGEFLIWRKPSPVKTYYNIATAASITAAARAVLLRGLSAAVDPVYCDTDSIICQKLVAEMDKTKLGAWKLEAVGNSLAIAGKKLYAVFEDIECVKQASKGAKLTPDQIKTIAQGGKVMFENPVPNFKLDGSTQFINRTLKATAKPYAWKSNGKRSTKQLAV